MVARMPISSSSSRASACFGALAGLDLAAGKLPQQGHRLIGTALADQHLAVANDQRSRDQTDGASGGPGIGILLDLFHGTSVTAPKGNKFQAQVFPFGGWERPPCRREMHPASERMNDSGN